MELNNLKNESIKLRMTPAEKAAMKAQIFGATSAMPAPQPSSYFAYSFQFLHARVLVPALALVLVFGGASTTAAAQGALPGDLLYPVKIFVNEGVEVALATTPVARAQVQAKLAERRVEEAEALAATGKLNAAVGEELAANFEEHAEDAESHVEQVAAQDPSAAAALRAKLGSSLLAHGEILATLTVGGSAENQEGTGAVAARVLARTSGSARPAYAPATIAMRAAKAAPEPQAMTMSLAADVASDTATATEAGGAVLEADTAAQQPIDEGSERDAARAQARAQEAFVGVRAQFDHNKDKYAASAITQVSGELAGIGELMELGSTTLATGHYAEAEGDYAQALERLTKLEVLLRVQARLKQNIITPILEQNIEIDSSFEVPGL